MSGSTKHITYANTPRKKAYRIAMHIVSLVCLWYTFVSAQSNNDFVIKNSDQLSLSGKPYYSVGVNAYYLQNLAAVGDTNHVIEVLQTAKSFGVNTIRTNAFFDANDTSGRAVIQYAPGKFNERGLRALDYVIAKAKQYSLRLILPLVNNWEDYGGMNQYVSWLGASPSLMNKEVTDFQQKTVYGVDDRSYRVYVTNTYTHDDFYSHDSVKSWYKNYLQTILNRRNTYNNILYKDDPTIFLWELANEPRSQDPSGNLVYQWLQEMSLYLKSIDANHLVASGEEGFDCFPERYSDKSLYNDQAWMFDGSNGISFTRNLTIPSLDVAGIHCYPTSWHLSPQASIVWFKDHQELAGNSGKPFIIGELGTLQSPQILYHVFFNQAFHSKTSGVLLWQLLYLGRRNNDGYGFTCPVNQQICSILTQYGYKFEQKRDGLVSNPTYARLYQNFPNPFTVMTVIAYDLPVRNNVKIDVFNEMGQFIVTLENDSQPAGYHETLFDATNHASGVYFVRIAIGSNILVRKIVLTK